MQAAESMYERKTNNNITPEVALVEKLNTCVSISAVVFSHVVGFGADSPQPRVGVAATQGE